MNYQKIGLIFLLIFYLFPIYQSQAISTNAGFIPSNIWYSKDPFEEGDKIKIYTFIFNPENKELSGTVSFYDKTTLLGNKKFAIPPNSIKDISINWTVNSGEHIIFATIENAKFISLDKTDDDIILNNNKTQESLRTVNKKIIPDEITEKSESNKTINRGFPINQITNVQNLVLDNTPEFIAKPMILGAETVEEFRNEIATSSQNKKEELKKEIDILNKKKPNTTNTEKNNSIMKPWKYVQYFFITFLSFISNNKFIFYPILIIFTFLLLRFIWRKIF